MTKKQLLENSALQFRVKVAKGEPVIPDTAFDALAEMTPHGYSGPGISAREILRAARRMGPLARLS